MRTLARVLTSGSIGVLLGAMLAATSAPAAVAAGSGGTDPYGTVLNILPPGSTGNVGSADLTQTTVGNLTGSPVPSVLTGLLDPQALLLTASPSTPAHFADQLEKYDALSTALPSALTDSSLTKYFKPSPLGVAADKIDHVEHPKAGVTITWDTDGVPHIHGTTRQNVAYGAGVALMEDRMFLTDVLRHTGRATMAQFVGPTDANIAQDAAQLRVAPYTDAELNAQISSLVKRSPQAAKLVSSIDAYIAGINAEQTKLCPLTTAAVPLPASLGLGYGVDCPVEYAALQRPPAPYTRADIVAIAALIGGIFGTGGGGQYTNAIWLQQLQAKYGRKQGTAMYNDLREKNDPEAPVTSPVRTPYGGPTKVRENLPGVAMPDLHPKAQALGTGAIVNSDGSLSAPPDSAAGNQGNASTTDPNVPGAATAAVTRAGVQAQADDIQGWLARAMSGQQVGMSNALIVDAKHSTTHHPTAVFGPQTGYYAPQLLMEQELDGPGIKARGVSFAGTTFVVEMGRGVDYAWSATSPYTDITDTVVQKLCNKDGSKATVNSTAYLRGGKCRAMDQFEHTESGLPSLAAAASPKSITFLVLRTDHGIVQRRTTLKGKPVAIVTQRSTYHHEPDSVLGFVDLNNPKKVHNAQGFMKAASKISFTFNWYYVDNKDIAYYSSARLPKRAKGTDLDLPRWADKKYDWTGFVGFKGHPHVVDPTTGYIANWNNKLAPGFASSSQVWGDGSVYRSLTLSDRIQSLMKKGLVSRASLVGAMSDAATVDVRGAYVLPYVLKVLGHPSAPQERKAVALMKAWVRDGAHRVDRKRTGSYPHQAAIRIFDTWWDPDDEQLATSCAPTCGFSLPRDAMRHGLGGLVDRLPEPMDDHPRLGIGSSWNGISWYGYLNKDLRSTLGMKVRGAYSRSYCGPLATCRAALRASLAKAIHLALSDEGVSDVAKLTYDKSLDDIVSVAGGVMGARPIDWQNRPTFQQVVRFRRHR